MKRVHIVDNHTAVPRYLFNCNIIILIKIHLKVLNWKYK